MAKDLSDVIRDSLNQVVQDAAENIGLNTGRRQSNGHLGGMTGMALGAGLAAAAPFAARRATRAATRAARARLAESPAGDIISDPERGLGDAASRLTDTVGREVMDNLRGRVEEAGGVGGIARSAAKDMIGLGGGGGGGRGQPGVGKGRRMPVQQSMDVGVPVETAYNQFTQYEDWPNFMHRVTSVTQDDEDPTEVRIATKIWAFKREFTANIETQRPDQRIRWRVSQGISHTGVVTFHELAPRLTRIELNVDVDPGSLIEKAARGMRHVKRAMRADLHRYKAFIEMQEMETGAWRGTIEDGEVVEDHDPAYDEERDYSEPEAMEGSAAAEEQDEDQYDEDEEAEGEEEPEAEGEEEPEAEGEEEPEAEADEDEDYDESESESEDEDEEPTGSSRANGDGGAPERRPARRRSTERPRARARSSSSSGRGRAAGSRRR